MNHHKNSLKFEAAVRGNDEETALAILDKYTRNIFHDSYLEYFLFLSIKHNMCNVEAKIVDKGINYNPIMASAAANVGNVEAVKRCVGSGIKIPVDVYTSLAIDGNQEFIKWLIANVPQPVSFWNIGICSGAAIGGHVELLRWAINQGFPLEDAAVTAYANDREDCLKHIHELGYICPEYQIKRCHICRAKLNI